MSSFDEHCQESIRNFGKPFAKVHLWLDEFAGQPPHGMRHRRFRHHEIGAQQAAVIFGPEAYEAAKRHIISDLMEEGWTMSDPFPMNEEHYIRMGLF